MKCSYTVIQKQMVGMFQPVGCCFGGRLQLPVFMQGIILNFVELACHPKDVFQEYWRVQAD